MKLVSSNSGGSIVSLYIAQPYARLVEIKTQRRKSAGAEKEEEDKEEEEEEEEEGGARRTRWGHSQSGLRLVHEILAGLSWFDRYAVRTGSSAVGSMAHMKLTKLVRVTIAVLIAVCYRVHDVAEGSGSKPLDSYK